MASIILSSVGSSVGNMFLPGLGGKLLSALGRRIGHTIDGEIGWSTSSSPKDGSRLENFKVQDSRYGLAIPMTFGRSRIAGNVIWTSGLIETAHEETLSGGKGGIVSNTFSQSRTTYTYSLNCAIALCEGEIGGIQTIWADSKVIYENGIWHSGIVTSANIHCGSLEQSVDPLLESWIGTGLTPAYRGVAYIVMEGLQLRNFGNRLPNLTFEVVPKSGSQEPVWLGETDPDIYHSVLANRQGGMKPIVVDGGAVTARRMLVGGYVGNGSSGHFVIIEYDVSGTQPVEIRRDQSADFSYTDVGDHCWAISPANRMIALGIQDGSVGYPYHVMLYDVLTHSFGAVTTLSMLNMEVRQIAWIDAHHILVNDYRDNRRGVRVLSLAGSALIDRGFFDVWGSASASSRVPVGYTQFSKLGHGILTFMGDQALNFTGLYGRYLEWVDNTLNVSAQYIVSSGYDLGTGSGPQVTLHQTSEDEWTLLYLTLVDLQMMSFVLTKTGITVTRPWQKFLHEGFTVSASNSAVVIGNRIVVVHRPSAINAYYTSEIVLDNGCFTRIGTALPVQGVTIACTNMNIARIDASRLMILGNVGSAGNLGQIGLIKRQDTSGALTQIVDRLLNRCGYQDGDYELSALDGLMIDGYAVSEQATAAGALEQLMLYHPFDLVETDGQLKAVLHGEGEEVLAQADDLGATAAMGEVPAPYIIQSRTQELDLPVEMRVDYLDASRDYEVGAQRARRHASSNAVSKATIEVPIVMTASAAKQLAARHLYGVWLERDRYRFVLARAYAMLCPSDILVVAGLRIRVISVTMKDGLVQVDGVAAVPSSFCGALAAESGSGVSNGPVNSLSTHLYLMDLPLLRNEDDRAGIYVTASGADGWRGATLWRAADGINYSRVLSFTDAAITGEAVSALLPARTEFPDESSNVQVQMLRGSLSSCSYAALLNGANAALLGAEIIQFRTATLIGPDLYQLSGFLRGRKGTESQTNNHQIGESFVFLSPSSLQFLPMQITDRGTTCQFRAVSDGGLLDYAQQLSVTFVLKTMAPLSPVHLRGVRAAGQGSDLTLTWIRRARKNGQWVDYIDTPLDQDVELYDVEIMDGEVVRRSIRGLTSPALVYSAAQQTADWGSTIPAYYTIKVYQRSSTYGRGDAAQVSI